MRKRTDYIVIHCSATRPSQNIDIEDITDWHVARGFLGCGYTKVITRSGEIQDGRGLMEVVAANKGYNHKSVAICMVGGVTQEDHTVAEDNFTDEQWEALEKVLDELTEKFPKANIIGHNQISSKDCPSFDVPKYLSKTKFADKALEEVK